MSALSSNSSLVIFPYGLVQRFWKKYVIELLKQSDMACHLYKGLAGNGKSFKF